MNPFDIDAMLGASPLRMREQVEGMLQDHLVQSNAAYRHMLVTLAPEAQALIPVIHMLTTRLWIAESIAVLAARVDSPATRALFEPSLQFLIERSQTINAEIGREYGAH